MLRIAIDGACRNNGKPNCVAAGGVFVANYTKQEQPTYYTVSTFARPSTSQRGELMALKLALAEAIFHETDTQIITDSEYIFNSMTKEWYVGWESRGWLTATLEPVKNVDLWKEIVFLIRACQDREMDVIFYHIKGHCMPFGKVTAARLLNEDNSGLKLLTAVNTRFNEIVSTLQPKLDIAQELSMKNNGFKFGPSTLGTFVAMNTVADAVATQCVEAASLLAD